MAWTGRAWFSRDACHTWTEGDEEVDDTAATISGGEAKRPATPAARIAQLRPGPPRRRGPGRPDAGQGPVPAEELQRLEQRRARPTGR